MEHTLYIAKLTQPSKDLNDKYDTIFIFWPHKYEPFYMLHFLDV